MCGMRNYFNCNVSGVKENCEVLCVNEYLD